MRTFSCQSGSNGNCIYIEAGTTRLLVDAGISGRQAALRMDGHGLPSQEIDALLVSHDHSDHARCGGIFQRKFGPTIYTTPKTLRACRGIWGKVDDVRTFRAGESFEAGETTIHTIPTPHDAKGSVCFVIEHDDRRLGVCTDLGFDFPDLKAILATLDAVYLESNYDPRMLSEGPYPAWLKARVAGDGGHLANDQAGALLRDCASERLQWAVLSHLSEINNTPKLALRTVRDIVGPDLDLHVAGRYEASTLLEIR
jgi:phosphoribosyl 1,2-cyclic phosphodiesterase